MFYGSWRHLESFSGSFLVRICLLGCLLRYLMKSLVFNGAIFEYITVKQCPPHLRIPMTWNHLVGVTQIPSGNKVKQLTLTISA